MNKLFVYLFLASLIVGCDNTSKWKTQAHENQNETSKTLSSYEKNVMRFRDSTSAMFLSGANGVMEKQDLSPTGKLKYFTPDEAFKATATFAPIENGEVILMQTNTDRTPEYRRFGTLQFSLGDAELALTLYQNVEQPEYLFCPFKDLTNGNLTYGAGRYLDFSLDDLLKPIVDFNYAYNPYCAYNKEYSCPIPPAENHLKVPIPAGEKKWH